MHYDARVLESEAPLLSASGHRKQIASCSRRRRCFWLLLLLLAPVLVASQLAERRALFLRQLTQPLQWFTIRGYHSRGYEVVAIPHIVHAKLASLVAQLREHPDRTYDGESNLEDVIIFGRSARLMIPHALQQEMRKAFHPMAEAFCECELEEAAVIGSNGVRLYYRGASLAAHLDWAHKFVVSATLNVRQSANHTRWPLTIQAFAGVSHAVTHREGEAVLYEGSRMLHGRPRPLEDEWYAAAFVGFVPRRYPAGRGWLTGLFVRMVRAVNRS